MTRREHVEAMYESVKAVLGPHDTALVRRALDRCLRHILPCWAEEKPTCPGWYWHKPPGVSEPRLLLVGHGRIDTKLMADLGPPHHFVDVQRIAGRWAGPLLPPRLITVGWAAHS